MIPSIAKLQSSNGHSTSPFLRSDATTALLRATDLPDLFRERDILLAHGWAEDGAMNYGSMNGERTFWQRMRRATKI